MRSGYAALALALLLAATRIVAHAQVPGTAQPVDEVALHLNAALDAFDAKNIKRAAQEVREAANALRSQAVSTGEADAERVRAGPRFAKIIAKQLRASAQNMDEAAAAIADGEIRTRRQLDTAIDMVAHGDMGRKWIVINDISPTDRGGRAGASRRAQPSSAR